MEGKEEREGQLSLSFPFCEIASQACCGVDEKIAFLEDYKFAASYFPGELGRMEGREGFVHFLPLHPFLPFPALKDVVTAPKIQKSK